MQRDIKVSVLMPSLNVADYIGEAIQSARGQTLRDIEIICIDAGSTDGTVEAIERFSDRDDRIRLVHSEIKSYGYQINRAVDMARGEYIAILETDDFAADDMYERLYDIATVNRCDYAKADYLAFFTQEDGEKFFLRRCTFLDEGLYDTVLKPAETPAVATDDWYLWQGIYRTSFLRRNTIRMSETRGAAFQDIGFLHKTSFLAERAIYIKDSLYRYRLDREAASSNAGKGFLYAGTEYQRIFEEMGADISREAERQFLLSRMAKSFLCAYAERTECPALEPERAEYYEWFRQVLLGACNRGVLNESVLHRSLYGRLKKMLTIPYERLDELYIREDKLEEAIGDPGVTPLVIFGCGNYGYDAHRWCRKKGYHITAFMDNDSSLWGKRIDRTPILSPESVGPDLSGVKFLIANEKHAEDIKAQLISHLVREEDIVFFRGEKEERRRFV